MRNYSRNFLAILLLFLSARVKCDVDQDRPNDIREVMGVANKLNLYSDPEWRALCHYRPYEGGWRSTIDDPKFFLSENGKANPEDELISTINALYSRDDKIAEKTSSRFVARLAWLRKRVSSQQKPRKRGLLISKNCWGRSNRTKVYWPSGRVPPREWQVRSVTSCLCFEYS